MRQRKKKQTQLHPQEETAAFSYARGKVRASKPKRFPMPGQRILRTMIVVWLCFGVYWLRGGKGFTTVTAIAALQCIQPYTRDIRVIAKERVVGTLIGSFWGLFLLYTERFLASEGVPYGIYHYILIGIFTGIVLYTTVVLRITEMAFFSAITFLSIAIDQIYDTRLLANTIDKTFDTLIGIALGTVVNIVQLPRRRNTDILFAPGIGEFFLRQGGMLEPYSRVELNRLIEDGARITISTMQTQATVRELLEDVDLRYPIVTMDGAALYDMKELSYIKTNPMSKEHARQLLDWLHKRHIPFFSNSIEENLLVIRYEELKNEAMEKLYETKRMSPYRNYLQGETKPSEFIVYILVVEKIDRLKALYQALKKEPMAKHFRIELVPDESDIPGYYGMKIYDAKTSQKAMLQELSKILGTTEIVTFGSDVKSCDVVVDGRDRNRVVKEIRDRFEPIDLRSWRNMLRI